jgi:hypothetical protein
MMAHILKPKVLFLKIQYSNIFALWLDKRSEVGPHSISNNPAIAGLEVAQGKRLKAQGID